MSWMSISNVWTSRFSYQYWIYGKGGLLKPDAFEAVEEKLKWIPQKKDIKWSNNAAGNNSSGISVNKLSLDTKVNGIPSINWAYIVPNMVIWKLNHTL
jgi:hypothetical protein